MPRPNGPHGDPGMPPPRRHEFGRGFGMEPPPPPRRPYRGCMPMGCLGCTIPAALGVLGMIGSSAVLIGTFL